MALLAKSGRLKKELGLFDVYAIATGTTLSAGFFLLPGLAVTEIGAALPLAYILAAVPLIPAMFSIVELGTAMPRAGGAYYFLDRSLGPLAGTIGGLGTWFSLMLKTAFALIGMGAYVQLLVPGMNARVIPIAAVCAILFGLVNLMGAKGAGKLQSVFVTGLLILLAWFLGGLRQMDPANFAGFGDRGLDALISTAGFVYISYIGVTKVASISEEIRRPERNLPLGVFLALGTAIVVYALGTSVMIGVVGEEKLSGDYTPAATTAGMLYGTLGIRLISIAAVLAFSSVANAGILSASRYPLAMSRDHLLPLPFRKLSAGNIPRLSVVVTVGIILLLVVAVDAAKIAKLASAFQLLIFAALCFAVIVMREARIDAYDPGFRSPLYPWMQIVGILTPMWLIAGMGAMPILFSLLLLLIGTAWYLRYAKPRVSRRGAVFHIFERLGHHRHAALNTELRGILKEKGLREHDPFDEIVARADVLDLAKASGFEAVARRAAALLAERTSTGAEHIFEGFMRGTRIGATPVAKGAALPHLRLPGIRCPEMVLVRAADGVSIDIISDFGEEIAADEAIKALFFFVSPEEDPGQHLRILAQIADHVDHDEFIGEWLSAKNESELQEALLRDERYMVITIQEQSNAFFLAGMPLRDVELPEGCLVAVVRRENEAFIPRMDTVLKENDRITVLGDPEGIRELAEMFS